MKKLSVLLCLIVSLSSIAKLDKIIVNKSKREMQLIEDGKIKYRFKVMLSRQAIGPKRQEGDNKVPEGKYLLNWQNKKSKYYKSIHINYPTEKDIQKSKKLGIDNPGGEIFIHGMPNELAIPISNQFAVKEFMYMFGIDWTKGCIALRDRELDIVWDEYYHGLPLIINP